MINFMFYSQIVLELSSCLFETSDSMIISPTYLFIIDIHTNDNHIINDIVSLLTSLQRVKGIINDSSSHLVLRDIYQARRSMSSWLIRDKEFAFQETTCHPRSGHEVLLSDCEKKIFLSGSFSSWSTGFETFFCANRQSNLDGRKEILGLLPG